MNRLLALQVFQQVAELSSFAKAGKRLNLSPSAVSKNIAELEAYTGVRLINRTTRRMALTQEGQLYLEHVLRALDALEEADRTLASRTPNPAGLLRVSAPMTVALTRLSSALPGFLHRYPDIKLDLHLDDRRVDIVREGFDLAIRGSDRLEDSSLIARKLSAMPHVVCAAPSYLEKHGKPLTPKDLRDHTCVRFSLSGHADVWEFRRAGQTESVLVDSRYSVTSSLAVRHALCAGFGISLIPRPYVEAHLISGELVAVLEDWMTVETTLYAVYHSRQHLAPKVRAFIDFVVEQFDNTGGTGGRRDA
ncbi:MAG: LysR family transcriptional regulator [Oricola sp.]